jgi:uncharacterized protein (TIGR02246 family)
MRMTLAVMMIALAAAPAAAREQSCAPLSEAELAGLFDRWNRSLATLRPAEVAGNYARNAVLLPTVSNQPRTTPALIEDYFRTFLAGKPQGTINERHMTIGCNMATDVGIYTFTLQGPKGPQTVRARHSFVYVPEGGTWKILRHHSSAMPEAEPVAAAGR